MSIVCEYNLLCTVSNIYKQTQDINQTVFSIKVGTQPFITYSFIINITAIRLKRQRKEKAKMEVFTHACWR